MSALRLRAAQGADEAALRKLLRETPIPGTFPMTYEREPDFFLAGDLEGDFHQTFLMVREDGEAVAMASRSVHQAYVNGRPEPLGYFSQWRIRPGTAEVASVLRRGGRNFREAHGDGRNRLYLASLVEGNDRARRILERGLAGFPFWKPLENFRTLVILGPRGKRGPQAPGFRRAGQEDLGAIARFLQERYQNYQLAPLWKEEDLADPVRCRGLVPKDLVILEEEGRIRACGALWDQRAFKQNVVQGYPRSMRWALPFLNGWAKILDRPVLPPVGGVFPQIFLSHLAVEKDDPETWAALLRTLLDEGKGKAYHVLGLAARHPALPLLRKRFRCLEYPTLLGVLGFEDGRALAESLDGRMAHVEIARL